MEKLDSEDRKEFELGNAPTNLLTEIRAALSSELKSNLLNLPPGAFDAVVSKALPNEHERAAFLNCPSNQLDKLPTWIVNAYGHAMQARLVERHDAFFKSVVPAHMAEYLRVWQSRERAHLLLIAKARDERIDSKGKMSLGGIRLSEKKWVLRQIERSKNLSGYFISSTICEAAKQNDHKFFKDLVKAIAAKKPRAESNWLEALAQPGISGVLAAKEPGDEVDWERCDSTPTFIVTNWCCWPHGSPLPPLCLFSHQALADFCAVCFGKNQGNPSVDSVSQWLSNSPRGFGLKQASQPRIKEVTVSSGIVSFA